MSKSGIGNCGAGVVALILAAGPHIAAAQDALSPPQAHSVDGKLYTYIDKMPQLPGGGGLIAIVTAIQQHIQYPLDALRDNLEGKIFVTFVVEADGQVRRARIVKSLRSDCDTVVVQAVRRLPRFEPGIQDGKAVAVSFTVPVTFAIKNPKPPRPGLVPR